MLYFFSRTSECLATMSSVSQWPSVITFGRMQ